MKIGDKVVHKNVHIQGEVVHVYDNAGINVLDVQCDNGLYYDGEDQWEPVKEEKRKKNSESVPTND